MKQFCIFLFILISISANSQSYEEIDEIVQRYPRFSKVEDLADKINKDFSKDIDKARASFFWLTQNVAYNLKEFYNPTQRSYSFSYATEEEKLQKLQSLKNKLVDETFKTKSGVCEEYAQSFKKICDLLDIEAVVIPGNVRNLSAEIGIVKRNTNHAWNAVKIDNKWLILDATWAAGYLMNGKWIKNFNAYFFDMPKEKIMKTHYPQEKIWQIRFGRMSEKDFYNQPIYSNTFLGTKTELASPKHGIIRISKNKNIEIEFKNLKPSFRISYLFKGNRYLQNPEISIENEITKVVIKNPRRNTELSVFIGQNRALQYKVLVQ